VRRLILLSLLCVSALGCQSPRQPETVLQVFADDAVTVTDVHFRSSGIDSVFWYRIIVPKVESNERLPVLYLCHGANSGPVEIIERSDVVTLSRASRLITVIPGADFSLADFLGIENSRATAESHSDDALVVLAESEHQILRQYEEFALRLGEKFLRIGA
jgi:hypothetical protein